jgi:hypothetical protein
MLRGCRDYQLAQHTPKELQAANSRLVNSLRNSRPDGHEWRLGTSGHPTSRYVRFQIEHHIRESGWSADSTTDACRDWLLDLPQDDITTAASRVAGTESLSQLVAAAEAAGDRLTVAKLAMLIAHEKHLDGGKESVSWYRKSEEQLLELSTVEVNGSTREQLDRLEIGCLTGMFAVQDPDDLQKFAQCVNRLIGTKAATDLPSEIGFLYFYQSYAVLMTACATEDCADLTAFQDLWMKFPRQLAQGAATIAVRDDREKCCLNLCTIAPMGSMLRHSEWDWDVIFGRGGEFLYEAMRVYDFDVHHVWAITTQMGIDT